MEKENLDSDGLEERLKRLFAKLDATREKVHAQEENLQRLRADLGSFHVMLGELPALEVAVPLEIASTRTSRWTGLTYAGLAVVGVALSLAGPWRHATARESLKLAEFARIEAPALDTQTLSDERQNSEILGLVYEYTAPGERRSVHDLLGPDIESSDGASPWVFVNLDPKTTLVSYKPDSETGENGPVYEFVVNRASGKVTADPETQLNLHTSAFVSRRRS